MENDSLNSSSSLAIELLNLHKEYNGITAVDNLNLKIAEGEIFGLLGPNGAGKSTTTNILSGRILPTAGTATVLGYDVLKEIRRIKGIIGVAPQEITLYEHLTAKEMLQLMGDLYGVPKSALGEKIHELLQFSGLDRKKQRIKTFSGGMKRRLNLVASMVHDPEILLLDEPTVGVDPQQRRRIWDMILDLKERGKTVILTTHLMDEADRLCDRVAIMDHGKIIALDVPSKLKKELGGKQVIEIVAEQPGILSSELDKIKGISEVLRSNHTNLEWEEPVGHLQVVSEAGMDLLPAVIYAAQLTRVKIESVAIREINLEDVFLALTGRSLREDEER
ncbi:MAG: ABC transporter ATP-binding protein [Candidatus Thorarchaeota archaeon]